MQVAKLPWPTLVLLAVAIMLAAGCSRAGAATTPTPPAQPEPIATGVPAPALEAAYRAIQAGSSLDDEARVRAAIDTYFTLKYESRLAGQALDLGIVIDRSTPQARRCTIMSWAALQVSFPERKLVWLARQAELERRTGPRPTDAMPGDGR